MSLLIEGMEMPTNCNVCNFHMLRVCCAADKDLAEKDTRPLIERRPEWCPLVPVPPHGRTIDADALTISTAVPLDGKPYRYVHIDNIKAAPTIIPPEEGKK